MSADRESFCHQGLDLRMVLGAGPTCLFQGQGPNSKEKISVLMLRLALEPNLEYWSRCSVQDPWIGLKIECCKNLSTHTCSLLTTVYLERGAKVLRAQ